MFRTTLISLTVILRCITDAALAMEPIPDESGLSGYVRPGIGVAGFKDNMVAGVAFVDTGNERIDSLGCPNSETTVIPSLNMDIRYTFADTRTQIHLGNQLEDMLRLDRATLLGVRQEFTDGGIAAAAFQFPGLPTRVWEDPYVTGIDREETDRDTGGMRFTWHRILGTRWQVEYGFRSIKIDEELSGRTQLGLSDAEAELLDREGKHHKIEVLHPFRVAEGQTLTPSVTVGRLDLDGDAMANDYWSLQITHTFRLPRWHVLSNIVAGRSKYDERNPVFGKKREDDRYGITVTGFYPEPFGLTGWNGLVSIGGLEQESNISFYDKQAVLANVGGIYRF